MAIYTGNRIALVGKTDRNFGVIVAFQTIFREYTRAEDGKGGSQHQTY